MLKKINIKKILVLGIMFCLLGDIGITAYASEKLNETEPNNTFETAELMQATSHSASDALKGNSSNQHPKEGSTSIDDEDWFKVYLNAGEQYVTFNGDFGLNYNIEVYNSNKTLIMKDIYSKSQVGGEAFFFEAYSSGYYYIKVIGTTPVLSHYIILVGGPLYLLESCSVPLGRITMSGNDEEYSFDISNETRIPKDAIVNCIKIRGILGSKLNGASARNIDTSNQLSLGRYTLEADGLVNLNIPVLSHWEITFGYNKNLTFYPTVNFSYVYPLTSTNAEEDVVIVP